MRHARSGRVIIQMAVIIGVGFALGVVDAMRRPVDLKPREMPPELVLPGPSGAKPAPSPAPPTDDLAPAPTPSASNTTVPATSPAPATGAFVQTPKDQLPKGQVTIDEAKAAYDQGLTDNMTFFIDSRKVEDFTAGHVLNAMRMDTKSFETGDPLELSLIPREAIVIVYCNGGHCDESENVAKRIQGSGYKKVYVMHDGLPGWKALGHPIGTGSEP